SAAFPSIMPEVSVNIAMSRKAPKSSRDVAAIPGRINRIHGRAKALMLPEFGSSKHMSNVLIIMNAKDSSVNSVLNLKYDKSVDKVIIALGITRIFTQEPDDRKEGRTPGLSAEDPVVQRLSRTVIPKHLL